MTQVIPHVGGAAYACWEKDSPGIDNPIGALSLIFGGLSVIGFFVPPVGAIMFVAGMTFGMWGYFGWGGYQQCPS